METAEAKRALALHRMPIKPLAQLVRHGLRNTDQTVGETTYAWEPGFKSRTQVTLKPVSSDQGQQVVNDEICLETTLAMVSQPLFGRLVFAKAPVSVQAEKDVPRGHIRRGIFAPKPFRTIKPFHEASSVPIQAVGTVDRFYTITFWSLFE
jgi:hypothetical protein